MYLFENPVLQRELLVNLRTGRSFLLLAGYQILLAGVVLLAWPQAERLDLTSSPPSARRLVDLFFIGQYVIASLMAPSFAAGAISGEKERTTFEMLLASPLRPGAIVIGKMVASLTHLGMLILASLPIIVLCLPLGGVSLYEVLAAYLGLILSVLLFGAIGIACSSYFSRTSASLVVSYLIILPLVMVGVLLWRSLEGSGELRLKWMLIIVPAYVLTLVVLLCGNAAGRLLYPPDIGSEGREVIDPELENKKAIGLIIQRDKFPDRLFAPPKKQSLMPDGSNPIYDKEIHSEIFSQGTLMLRLVIQISIFLAVPLMIQLLFLTPQFCGWYMVYVIVFNMLVAPVFLAGSISNERERQTLDLLLTSPITASQILWGKLLVGVRVAFVLTCFLLWPLVLALVLVDVYWTNLDSIALMVLILLMVCAANGVIAMFCSSICHKTSVALMSTYSIILGLYILPISAATLLRILGIRLDQEKWLSVTSPFAAIFGVPLDSRVTTSGEMGNVGDLPMVAAYFAITLLVVSAMFGWIIVRLRSRHGLTD